MTNNMTIIIATTQREPFKITALTAANKIIIVEKSAVSLRISQFSILELHMAIFLPVSSREKLPT